MQIPANAKNDSTTSNSKPPEGGNKISTDLLAALQKLGFPGLDEEAAARIEKVLAKRASQSAEDAHARELVKAREELLEPRALMRLLAEAVLPRRKPRDNKPPGTATASIVAADSLESAPNPDASASGKSGVSGVTNA